MKADPGKHPATDVYPVLKLNVVRDFQTGIYNYNTLTSVFAREDVTFNAFKNVIKATIADTNSPTAHVNLKDPAVRGSLVPILAQSWRVSRPHPMTPPANPIARNTPPMMGRMA